LGPGATTQDPQGLKAWERGGFCDNRLREDDGRGVFCPFATPSKAGMTVVWLFELCCTAGTRAKSDSHSYGQLRMRSHGERGNAVLGGLVLSTMPLP
nr:hypothetical protein [Endozoicomonas sp.]